MPYTYDNPPDWLKNLPVGAQHIGIDTFNRVLKDTGSEEQARRAAWANIKRKYHKVGDVWKKLEVAHSMMDDKPHEAVMQNHFRCDLEIYLPMNVGLPGSAPFENVLNGMIKSEHFDEQIQTRVDWGVDPDVVYFGRSVHMDLRIANTDNTSLPLVFSITHAQPGRIKKPVVSMSDAKEIASRWNHYFRMIDDTKSYLRSPLKKLWVEPREPESIDWLYTEGVVLREEEGTTKYEFGVFHIIDKPIIYLGTIKDEFYEFFVYGERFTGRWVIRRLNNPWKQDMPGREFVWLMWKPKNQTPYVLSKRSITKEWIPPQGISCLPPEIRTQIPKENRYWLSPEKDKRLEERKQLYELLKSNELEIKPVEIIRKGGD